MTPIEIPIPPRILNPNETGHWGKKAKAKKQYRGDCTLLAKVHSWTCKPCIHGGTIDLHIQWFPKTNHDYDEDNAIASLKAALDGIAEAWGVNDTRFHIARFEKMPKVKGGKVLISILEQEECLV
jgi:crossover junction endodeoxyribonuclease RusA